MISVDVMNYATGDRITSIEIRSDDWDLYTQCRNPDFRWPEGIALASSILGPDQIDDAGIKDRTIVRLEG